MPEVVPLVFMPGGKPNAVCVATVEPSFMLWKCHGSKTEIAIEYGDHGGALLAILQRVDIAAISIQQADFGEARKKTPWRSSSQ